MKALFVVLLSGCGLTHIYEDGSGGEQDPNPNPTNPTNPPSTIRAVGTYRVASTIDLTVEALLPEPAENFVVTLRDFSTAPSHTLLDLAADAGVPAVGTLRAALPDSLESRLEGWLDGEIALVKINGVPVTQYAGDIAALAESTLTQFELDSELTVVSTNATHKLTKLDFSPAGLDVQLPLDSLPSDITSASLSSAVTTTSDILLTDHMFSLPYGEYAWHAVDAEVGGIRAVVGSAVNCPAVAAHVANKCVLGLCVGHASELTQICEAGLDEVVDRVHAEFTALRFDALHLEFGKAKLIDVDADRIADRFVDGVWTSELDAGQGLRPVPATFTAAR